MGGPLDCSVACVVEGRVEGFRVAVLGICKRKRAAEVVDAREARFAIEKRIISKVVSGGMQSVARLWLPTMDRDFRRHAEKL
jgi:hypothetical protein